MKSLVQITDPGCCEGPWALPDDVREVPAEGLGLWLSTARPGAIRKIHAGDCEEKK